MLKHAKHIILAITITAIFASQAIAETPAFSTNIKGYSLSCTDKPAIFKKEGDEWKKISQDLPGKGMYYLDDKFVGYGMCDVVVCNELTESYTVALIEYRKASDKPTPADWRANTSATTMPAYQAVPLNGEIKIDIEYFDDKECKNKKLFSTILTK